MGPIPRRANFVIRGLELSPTPDFLGGRRTEVEIKAQEFNQRCLHTETSVEKQRTGVENF